MNIIDRFLNNVTMYRLVVYGLLVMAAGGFAFTLTGRLHFSPVAMIVSMAILVAATFTTDFVMARIWNVPRNSESWLITALILFLILSPPGNVAAAAALALAGIIANASKYILNWRGKHIFNPAALAAACLSLTAIDPASWWIGNTATWWLVLLVGAAFVRKIRRVAMVLVFAIVTIITQVVVFLLHHQSVLGDMRSVLIASPLIFLSTVMLTEPATMPPRRGQQLVFAAGIAVLYVTAWKIGPLYVYPEVALLLGNIYAFIVSPKHRLRLQLVEVQRISDRVYNYVFRPDRPPSFLPGQYMEWTLAGVPFDNRGNRRTFTLASSPTEQEVHLGLKYYDPPSMFKYTFSRLRPGDEIYAGQTAGNFVLKGHQDRKLVFIAGGIGITPFRSMVKQIIDTKSSCDIVLLYAVSDPAELAYGEVFRAAKPNGVKFLPITTKEGEAPGFIHAALDDRLITQAVPDFNERLFYISGPDAMVKATKTHLHRLGVLPSQIKTDYFSGY